MEADQKPGAGAGEGARGGTRDLRVYFAGERTTLAWVRTGLALMGFGFVMARFGLFLRELALERGAVPPPHTGRTSLWTGVALVTLGVLINAYAAVRHASFTRRYDAGDPARPSSAVPVVVAVVLAVMGVGVTAYLLTTG